MRCLKATRDGDIACRISILADGNVFHYDKMSRWTVFYPFSKTGHASSGTTPARRESAISDLSPSASHTNLASHPKMKMRSRKQTGRSLYNNLCWIPLKLFNRCSHIQKTRKIPRVFSWAKIRISILKLLNDFMNQASTNIKKQYTAGVKALTIKKNPRYLWTSFAQIKGQDPKNEYNDSARRSDTHHHWTSLRSNPQ